MSKKMYKLVNNFRDYLDNVTPNGDNTRFDIEDIEYFANYFNTDVDTILHDFIPIHWKETNRTRYKKEMKRLKYLLKYSDFVEYRCVWREEEARVFYKNNIKFSYDFGHTGIYRICSIEIGVTLGELKSYIESVCAIFNNIEIDISSTRLINETSYQIDGRLNSMHCLFFTYKRILYLVVENAIPWISQDKYQDKVKELIDTCTEDTLIWHDVLHNNG